MNLPTPPNDDDHCKPPADDSLPEVDGPRATQEEREQMYRDPALRGALERFFAKRVPAGEVDDLVQDTLIAAYRAPNLPGGAGAESDKRDRRDKYVFGIANKMLAERRRRGQRQVPIARGVTFDRAVQGPDVVADRDLFAKVTDVGADKQFEMMCLARMAMGHSLKEIAREENVPYKPLHKRVIKLRNDVIARYGGGLLALVLAIFVGREVQRRPPPMAFDEPDPVAALEPAVSTHVGEVDPMDWARVLRGEAFRACMADKWLECLDGLEAARDLDPDGDRDPMVVAARKDAIDGYDASRKPGSTWTPPVVRAYASQASR